MQYDVFISHAGEDKVDFVRPLASALQDRRVEVWYDDFTLKAGDRLRREIDKGLRESRYGVVVLSPSFFGKQWPEWELDGLVTLQNSGQEGRILPIWHGVSAADVRRYSPSLAGIEPLTRVMASRPSCRSCFASSTRKARHSLWPATPLSTSAWRPQ